MGCATIIGIWLSPIWGVALVVVPLYWLVLRTSVHFGDTTPQAAWIIGILTAVVIWLPALLIGITTVVGICRWWRDR